MKDNEGKLVYEGSETPEIETKKFGDICTYVSGTEKTVGAKYSCDLGAGERNFYILELGTNPVSNSTLESDEVALILEGNYDTTTQAVTKMDQIQTITCVQQMD